MKYLAGLSDLHGTVVGAAKALDNLNSISGHLAGVVMHKRMRRMGTMGDGSTMAPIDFGAVFDQSAGVIDFGQQSGVVSQTANQQGGTTTKYSDGSILITNSQGQDITSNFAAPGMQTSWQLATGSIGDAVINLPNTIGTAGAGVVKVASGVLTPLAILAAVGLVAYMMFSSRGRA